MLNIAKKKMKHTCFFLAEGIVFVTGVFYRETIKLLELIC